ncbi:hypothetical protein Poli38472_003840 [Pythium oligandrum]|uniref:RING-type E3 ubiquitin transferase n=1 Tax=Pythium oligandrum TaxID=41045 RepID=A0A8K1FJH4_PYTOL|nr:hypothetical protein Poli38472_003840 [Pythium oligandrum]|eukprot:TMW66075.1 hypothetical protein Poli38472_003840 [Pythium oligandrum]
MASFDDLAFASTRNAQNGGGSVLGAVTQLFCKDCNEIAEQTTADGKRCLVCGCELEARGSRPNQATTNGLAALGGGITNAQDFESLISQLLSTIGGEFGVSNEARRPASDEAVTKLGSFTADQASTIEVAMVVSGIKGEVLAIPANFGPCDSLPRAEVVVADPIDGASQLANAASIAGKIVVMERGTCTFAQKVLRAQSAGAAAVIIIQTFDVWPYTMTDSKGESSVITIPAFMLSMKQGQRFLEYLRDQTRDEDAVAEITVRKDARECVICQVDMTIGATLTRMPCQHMFHTECLHQWLKIGNSCPICRVEIQSKHGSSSNTADHAQNDARRAAWGAWFS